MEVVSAPFEVVGEAFRMPIEGDSDFRAPSILQRIGLAEKTEKPPADPINLAMKLGRSGAVGLHAAATGKPALDAARTEYNRPPNMADFAQDVIAGAVTGRGFPRVASAPLTAAINATGATLKAGATAGKWAGEKAIRTALGPSEEAQRARFANPAGFKAAPLEGEIADGVAKTANSLSNKISEADAEAWGTLKKSYSPREGAISKAEVLALLKKAKKDLQVYGGGAIGKASKAATKALNEIENDIMGVGSDFAQDVIAPKNDYIPEVTVKGIIKKLDENIDWDDDTLKPINDALQSRRVALDGRLKGQNTKYREKMKPVDEMMVALTGLKRKMSLTEVRGEGFAPSDTTISKVKAIGKREMPETKRILEGTKKYTGRDIESEARTALLKGEFSGGVDRSRGSRRAIMGGAVGEAVGSSLGLPNLLGGAVGAGAGAAADFYGSQAAGKIIDALSKSNVSVGQMISAMRGKTKNTALGVLIDNILSGQGVVGAAEDPMADGISGLAEMLRRRGRT
jgi:hypothetical protein